MIIVRFNRWEEFIEELKANPSEDKVVRLTVSLRYNGERRPYRTLVAGFVSKSQIVEYVQYLGTAANGERQEEIEAHLEARKKVLETIGYKVRAGRYHVPPNLGR